MFLSRARLFNQHVFPNGKDWGGQDIVVESTGKDFGVRNAKLIEAAFEKIKEHALYEDREEWIGKISIGVVAAKFGKAFRSPRKRLAAIMQNVLDNNGVFRPDKVKKPA